MEKNMKILSVIIPTYNMEALLPRCLDSLVYVNGADRLEVCVVNDGSKDHSLQVAQKYQAKYPDIVTVIDKPNGNYGSTINAALPIVKGKYVKILESDDWFDTDALSKYLNILSETDADMIITHFTQIGAKNSEVVRYNTMGREPYEYGKVYMLDEVLKDGYIRYFLMHALTYRAEMLRSHHYRQTEGISYTDTEWSCYPTFYAQTICFCNLNLYQYNLDREGQTMDPKVMQKSLDQLLKLTDTMFEYYGENKDTLSPQRGLWMKKYFENRLRMLYKFFLLDVPRENFNAEELHKIDEKYSSICTAYQLHPKLYADNKLLRIEYISYWHRYHQRWPRWLEKLNGGLDVVAKKIYVILFRR
jgi:glycosyltransferase involved in cell wall biosynthesis